MSIITMDTRCWYISQQFIICEHYKTKQPIIILLQDTIRKEDMDEALKLNKMEIIGDLQVEDGKKYYPLKEVNNA